MELHYIKCNPSGNITALVTDTLPRKEYKAAAAAIMGKTEQGVEQVGFLEKKEDGNYHLEMMGGEFCGNASRCFAACLALNALGDTEPKNFDDEILVQIIDVSGCDFELVAHVKNRNSDTACYVEMAMPCPLDLIHGGHKTMGSYTMLPFDGITHVILWGGEPSEERVMEVKDFLEEQMVSTECYGVMFYKESEHSMTPAVYVDKTGTLVWESSCGSGTVAATAALAHFYGQDMEGHIVHQPGGDLEASVIWLSNGMQATLGGEITIMGTETIAFETE